MLTQATSTADNGKSDCISSIARENFPTKSTCSAHKDKSATDCAEQSVRDQWNEIRIKKHNEFLYLKFREKKEQDSQEKCSRKSSSHSKQKIQSNYSIKVKMVNCDRRSCKNSNRIDKSQGSKRSKRKNQQRSIKAIYRESVSKSDSVRKILLLCGSQIRRLDEEKVLRWPIVAKGIGGITSDQLISRHKQTINSNL